MITALALMLSQDVVNSCNELRAVIRNKYDEDADEVLDYLEETSFSEECPSKPLLISYRAMEHIQSNH